MSTFVILHNGRLAGISRNFGDIEHQIQEFMDTKIQERKFAYAVSPVGKSQVLGKLNGSVEYTLQPLRVSEGEADLLFIPGTIKCYTVTGVIQRDGQTYGVARRTVYHENFYVYEYPDLEAS